MLVGMTLLEMLWRFAIFKVESPFSREKTGSSPSNSRSTGDNAEVKAVVACAGLGVRKQS